MRKRLSFMMERLKRLSFYKKRTFYIILVILFSIILAADVAVAVLVPTQNFGGRQNNWSEIADLQENADGDSEDNADSEEEERTFPGRSDSENGRMTPPGGTDSEDGQMAFPGGTDSEDGEMAFPGGTDSEDGEMAFPGGTDSEDGQMAFPGGTDSEDGQMTFPGGTDSEKGNRTKTGSTGFLQTVKSHWLLIFIIFAILDALSILGLILVSGKEKIQKQPMQDQEGIITIEGFNGANVKKNAARKDVAGKKRDKREKHPYLAGGIILAGVILLIITVKALSSQTEEDAKTTASVYSGTAEIGEISSILPGTGTLTDEEAVTVELPAGVEITEWYVSNGDEVEEGDKLAQVDTVSTMSAIVEIQEKLIKLDEALAEHEEETISDTIAASTEGKVKFIYAQDDKSVVETMYEHGSLMLISLDGMMAVSIETDANLSAGDTVTVTLSDDTTVDGKVQSVLDGTVIITLSDENSDYGETVTAAAEDGTKLGTGTLYIHSELKITGFTGTVSDVKVSVDEEVEEGDTLITLTDTDYTGEYELLLAQREKLEDQMRQLFQIYQDQYLYADCAGVISGLETDEASDLSDTVDESADATNTTDSSGSDLTATGTSNESRSYKIITAQNMSYKTAASTGTVQQLSANTAVQNSTQAENNSQTETEAENKNESGAVTESGDGTEIGTGTEEETKQETSAEETNGSGSEAESETETESKDETGSGESNGNDQSQENNSKPDTEAGGGSTGSNSYTNYIGTVTFAEKSGDNIIVGLEMAPGTGNNMAGSSKRILPSSTYVYTFANGKYAAGTASDIQVNDLLMLVYESGEEDGSPILCIRISEEDISEGNSSGETDKAGSSEIPDGSNHTENSSGSDGNEQSGGAENSGNAMNSQSASESGVLNGQNSSRGSVNSSATGSGSTGSVSQEAYEEVMEELEEEVETSYGVTTTEWLSVTPQDTMEVTITVDEMDILSLEEGQKAQVTLDAFPGQSFEGTVTAINLEGENSGGSSKYEAVVSIAREENMLAGMNASVLITLETDEDVLLIPEAALIEQESGVYVYTSYNEKTETFGDLVEVTTGVSDGEQVEILSGLTEGSEYWYSCLDAVNYSTYSSSENGSFSLKSVFGGSGRKGR